MMKKIVNKNVIFSFILGGIILCSGIVYGVTLYKAKDVTYSNESSEVTNVNDALDELYNSSGNTVIASGISAGCSNSYNITPKVDESLIELNGVKMKLKKSGTYNIYYGVYGLVSGSNYPSISLYINNKLIFNKNTYAFEMNYPINGVYTVDLNEGDEIYLTGHALENVTCSLANFYIYR